jgi:hypothetical protein
MYSRWYSNALPPSKAAKCNIQYNKMVNFLLLHCEQLPGVPVHIHHIHP